MVVYGLVNERHSRVLARFGDGALFHRGASMGPYDAIAGLHFDVVSSIVFSNIVVLQDGHDFSLFVGGSDSHDEGGGEDHLRKPPPLLNSYLS